MIDFLEFTFKNFWHFLGVVILFSMPLKLIAFMWNRYWRHKNIREHGYPPIHCDADGDFKETQ